MVIAQDKNIMMHVQWAGALWHCKTADERNSARDEFYIWYDFTWSMGEDGWREQTAKERKKNLQTDKTVYMHNKCQDMPKKHMGQVRWFTTRDQPGVRELL